MVKYNAIRGGTSFLPTPNLLASKKAIINVYNDSDYACFQWSILSGLNDVGTNPQRVSKYRRFIAQLNMEGIPFPTPIDKRIFTKFLENNPGE